MEDEKPHHSVGRQHQPKKQAVSHDAAAADVVETGKQDANTPQEPVAAPKEEAAAVTRDAAATSEDTLEACTEEGTMEWWQDQFAASSDEYESDDEDPIVAAGKLNLEILRAHLAAGEDMLFAGPGGDYVQGEFVQAAFGPATMVHGGPVRRSPAPHGFDVATGRRRRLLIRSLADILNDRDPTNAAAARGRSVQCQCAHCSKPRCNREESRRALQRLHSPEPARWAAAPTAAADDDDDTSRRQATDSPAVFPGSEEGRDDNDWYDSIARDAQMLEQMEEPGLYLYDGISLEEHIIARGKAPMEEEPSHRRRLTAAQEDGPEFSLEDIAQTWGLHPSELDPDEPGPSTTTSKTQTTKVPPLADDEVPKFDCGICFETHPIFDIFHGMQCHHRFCVQCMATYIDGRVRAGEVPIPCPDPDCMGNENGVLHPEDCKKSIDFAAFCSWGDRLAESVVPPGLRVYCPNRECGVMLETTGATTPARAACPACSRLMCETCGMDWSTDGSGQHDCAEGPEAVLVQKLAAERRWKQCPRCKILVEKTMGCSVIRCRCQFVFCYKCGLSMEPGQEGGVEVCRCRNVHDLDGPSAFMQE